MVESEACPGRDANPVERNDAEHQRASRIADAVDDHAIAAVAKLAVSRLVFVDQTAVIARDPIFGIGRGDVASDR